MQTACNIYAYVGRVTRARWHGMGGVSVRCQSESDHNNCCDERIITAGTASTASAAATSVFVVVTAAAKPYDAAHQHHDVSAHQKAYIPFALPTRLVLRLRADCITYARDEVRGLIAHMSTGLLSKMITNKYAHSKIY